MTLASLPVVVFIWVFMIPFLPLAIATAPIYLANVSDTGVIGTAFAPDGSHMLVTYRDDARTTIYRMDFDGGNVEPLTPGDSFDFDPVYSPDGSTIAFSRRSKRRISHLHLMNADGSNVRQVTMGRREDFTPRFSPDGTQIVLSSYMLRKQADLFVVEVDTGHETRLTNETDSHDVSPIFLPDGNTILFSRARWFGHSSPIASSDWHDFGLYAIPAAGGQPIKLSGEETYRQATLRLNESPDRRFLLFDGEYLEMDRAAFDSLVAKGAQYLALRALPEALNHAEVQDVSVDRRLVLALDDHFGEERDTVLFVLNLDTNEVREAVRIERQFAIAEPKFTPDGEHIVYREEIHGPTAKTHETLWIATLDGERRRLDSAIPGVPEWTLEEAEADASIVAGAVL